MQPTREEFLARRRQGIGGSDIAVILGLSPWTTQVQLKREKKGEYQAEETPAMRRGTVLEPVVADEYAEHYGVKVVRHNLQMQEGIFTGNIDRLVVPKDSSIAAYKGEIRTDKGLEIKTARDNRNWQDGVPEYYQTQVLWYMGLAPSIMTMDVAVKFVDSWTNAYFTVARDDEVIAFMKDKAQEWWQKYIVEDAEPEPVNEADCKILWARSNPGKSIVATAKDMELLEAYRQADEAAKSAKANADALKTELVCRLGDAEMLCDANGKPLASYKSAKDSVKSDWETIAHAACPNGIPADILTAYTKTVAGSRRFLVK